jgi:outer membrane protein OmpA-like peptidoglycan-associated protein
MNKLLIMLILSISTQLLLSQESKIIFIDNFDDDRNNWQKMQGTIVKNGAYLIKNTSHELQMYTYQIFTDYRENFTIETSIKQTKGDNSEGYGLCWGSLGWQNSFIFLISSSGYFCIGGYEESKYFEVSPWTKSKAIKTNGLYNKLVVEKSGIILNFYINDVKVFTSRFVKFYGQMQGFILKKSVEASVDYLKIQSDPKKIDITTTEFSKFKKENMGLNINSPYSEIAPIISPDGKTLYIGRIYHPQNFGKDKECDIWYSTLQDDGTWSKIQNIGKPLNNNGVNVVITVTPDGNAMLLEGLYNSDGSHKSEQGISISYKTEKGWSVPKEVKVHDFYNKNIYETYCLSNDRKVLILSIERDDSYGDLDLYVSFLQEDGSYTKPKNMGPVLNTFAGDGTPFLAMDNTTLYFSSYGKHGYGSADIYVTKRLDDTWLNWSKPKNMGTSINSTDWDTYLSISAKGDYAYLVSTHNSYGNEDIFQLKLQEEVQPDPVVLVYGKVLNEKTKRPVGAKISYENLANGKEVGIAQSDPKTGEYKIVLPYGIQYGFRAEAKNFLSENENIDLRGIKKYQEIKKDLFLIPLEIGESIVLKNVFFVQAQSILLETSYPELDRLYDLMKRNPNLEIELAGHTENRGNPKELLELSEKRVQAVEAYLVEKGIDEKRISGKGYGGAKPLTAGTTDEERALNRRVEFKVLKK